MKFFIIIVNLVMLWISTYLCHITPNEAWYSTTLYVTLAVIHVLFGAYLILALAKD